MLSAGDLTITDPTDDPDRESGFWLKTFGPMLKESRDLPFVRLSLLLAGIFWPLAIALFIPGVFRWFLAPVYWALYLFFLGPFVLMLHNTSHRTLFNKDHAYLNRFIPWLVGPFLGQSPETYFVHHMGIHHREGNLPNDLSSTMKYQRDSFIDFLKYYLTFLFLGDAQVVGYLRKRNRKKLVRRFLVGEFTHLALIGVLLALNWRATLVVFVVPLVTTRFLLMAGNWAQHAFVDPDDPTNDWKTVITFINSGYNHRCFNDGYHLGHHLKASRHWLEMPADFAAHTQRVIDEESLVFRKLDYFVIFLLLMFKQHRFLARYAVWLDPDGGKSIDETVALFHKRLRKFDRDTLDAIRAG